MLMPRADMIAMSGEAACRTH